MLIKLKMKTYLFSIVLCIVFGLALGQDCGEERWVCDGENDCGDRSDEPEGCPACGIGMWECANGNCVQIIYICDGDNDCGDMSDELDPETGTCPLCPDTHFQCANGRCVEPSRVCNGQNDCRDNSDELEDPDQCPECGEGQFRCNTGRCIFDSYICDGVDNCGDRSDEPENPDDCPTCDSNEFRCSNGKCIRGSYVCDNDNDCLDWSDETEEACPCSDDEMRCTKPPTEEPSAPGSCIPAEWICDEDGIWDCPDGSDEANCTSNSVNSVNRNHSQGRKSSAIHYLPKRNKNVHKNKKLLSHYSKSQTSGKTKSGKEMSYLWHKMLKKYAKKIK